MRGRGLTPAGAPDSLPPEGRGTPRGIPPELRRRLRLRLRLRLCCGRPRLRTVAGCGDFSSAGLGGWGSPSGTRTSVRTLILQSGLCTLSGIPSIHNRSVCPLFLNCWCCGLGARMSGQRPRPDSVLVPTALNPAVSAVRGRAWRPVRCGRGTGACVHGGQIGRPGRPRTVMSRE